MAYKIGDIAHGGIIFAVDKYGEHGFVAAESDQGRKTWYEAKKICSELKLQGYEDWILPSMRELFQMYNALHIYGHGDFTSDWYWSSQESDYIGPWAHNFRTGDRYRVHPIEHNYIRAVRAF